MIFALPLRPNLVLLEATSATGYTTWETVAQIDNAGSIEHASYVKNKDLIAGMEVLVDVSC